MKTKAKNAKALPRVVINSWKQSASGGEAALMYLGFDVRVVDDRSYPLRGNGNNYRMSDVAFGVRLDGETIVELK